MKVFFRRLAGVILNTLLWTVFLFVSAGTVNWPRAWIFLAVNFAAVTTVLFTISAELLEERYKGPIQKTQPFADKIVLAAFILSFVAVVMLVPKDVFQLHLIKAPPLAVSVAGLLMFVAGWYLVGAALVANKYAAPVVKLQSDRQQNVVQRGPYHLVRHPMYSGLILLGVGVVLWLGSYAATILMIVPAVLIAVRAVLEERFLRRSLPGYDEYMRRTRFRLVPFVW